MTRSLLLVLTGLLTACSGRAWNTTVAETPVMRAAIADSVIVGETTETAFIGRWGRPVQTLREGAQVSYIYRDMRNPPGGYPLQFGDSSRYVIVDFQYGIATGVRTTESVGCRATFPPRPPSYTLDNPSTVRPVNCPAAGAIIVADRPYGPGKY